MDRDTLLNELAFSMYGMSRDEAWHQSVCVCCKENIEDVPHEVTEYMMSALCDNCFPKEEDY